MLNVLLQALLVASACSLDAFAASFAYGTKGIKIPFLSNIIINVTCSAILGMTLWVGAVINRFLPDWLTIVLAFAILFVLGAIKLFDSITMLIIQHHKRRYGEKLSKEVKFSCLNFSFILNLYAEPEDADINENKIISSGEAVLLAVSLSLDGIAVGFGAAFANINIPALFLVSILTNMLAVCLGCCLGEKISRKCPLNMSWIGGLTLMGLAISRLF